MSVKIFLSAVVAFLVLAVLADRFDRGRGKQEHEIDDDGYRYQCGGRGKAYCKEWFKRSCPSTCKDICDDSDAGSSNDLRKELERALNKRVYDQVFMEDVKFCVANCKMNSAKCNKYDYYRNKKFCRAIKCGGLIDGCHSKNDFSELDCSICKRIFPKCRD